MMNDLNETCPLCGTAKHMHKAKPLYGHKVCGKCYYAFANRRQFAYALDVVVLYFLVILFAVMIGVVMAMGGASQAAVATAGALVGWFMLPLFICKDCFSGHSLGKLICGVRVIDKTTGKPTGIGASFKRNLPILIPFWVLVIGYQLCKGHRDGDGWSNTKVIWEKYANHPIFAPDQVQS